MASKYIVLDFETFYSTEYSLRRMTPVEYILDPRFECMGAAATEGDDGETRWIDAENLPAYLDTKRNQNIAFISHNALFDMCLLAWRFRFLPKLMVDTMSMARAMVFHETGSVSLENVAAHLGLGAKTKTILKVAGMTGAMIRQAGLWGEYTEYACNDADLCRGIFKHLRKAFPASEYGVMDAVIRAAVVPRFQLDTHVLAEHAHKLAVEKQALLDRVGLTSRDDLMSNDKFADALRRLGIEPPMKTSIKTGKAAYAFAKTDQAMADLEEDPNPEVQALVAARLGHKSTIEETRTQRFINISQVTWPGNLGALWMPMPLRYSGAHTHRLSGDWKLNVQNLPRGGTLRRSLKAPPGYIIVTCDAAQIEARLNAYVAGQDDLVEAFQRGEDIYSLFAGEEIYQRPVNKKEHPKERFVGKQAILGLGYNMGAPKFTTKVRTDSRLQLGEEMIMELTEGTAIVQAYRRKYAAISGGWRKLHNLLPELARHNSQIQYGPMVFEHQAIRGPNGQRLFYRDLKQEVIDGQTRWRFVYGKTPKDLYGGKLTENFMQFLARIAITEAAERVRKYFPKYSFALQVHDELVYVVPIAMADELKRCLVEEMSVSPGWAPGLPLVGEAGVGPTYGDAK